MLHCYILTKNCNIDIFLNVLCMRVACLNIISKTKEISA